MIAFDLSKIEGFEWDKGNLEHIKKRYVEFGECEQVFFNMPILVGEDKTHSQTEKRFEVLGKTNNKRLLFVVYTVREGKIRIVSARDQNKKERREYQKTKENSKI